MSPHDPQNAIFNVGVRLSLIIWRDVTTMLSLHAGWPFNSGPEWRAARIYIASLAQAGRLEEARAAAGANERNAS